MKNDVKAFVLKCLTCKQEKFKHQKSRGKLQPLDISMWKWDDIAFDFVVGLPRSKKNHNAI